MYIALALLPGIFVIVCISINGQLAKRVGLIQAGITNFGVGLISALIYAFVLGGLTFSNLISFPDNVPIYYYLGGAIGSGIMLLNSLIINNLPAVYVTILVFLGQLVTGMTIDYMSSSTLSYGKILGGIIIVIGLYTYIKGDNLAQEATE